MSHVTCHVSRNFIFQSNVVASQLITLVPGRWETSRGCARPRPTDWGLASAPTSPSPSRGWRPRWVWQVSSGLQSSKNCSVWQWDTTSQWRPWREGRLECWPVRIYSSLRLSPARETWAARGCWGGGRGRAGRTLMTSSCSPCSAQDRLSLIPNLSLRKNVVCLH